MNSKQIDCILELAQSLNFNRAAENLYITQPTLTYHIKTVEEEIGFPIFHRSGKGASLTPAGQQFCITLRSLREEMKRAVEQGQNNSRRYQQGLTIGLPLRSAIYFLPQAIETFEKQNEGVSVTPEFTPLHNYDRFLRGEQDMVFAREEDMKRIPDIKIHRLFRSKIYLISEKTDPLARKELIKLEDLAGRTLMVGGGSQAELRAVQQRVLQHLHLDHFNSNDHDTTLTNIAWPPVSSMTIMMNSHGPLSTVRKPFPASLSPTPATNGQWYLNLLKYYRTVTLPARSFRYKNAIVFSLY